jgi:Ribonuclease P 40kDa (Rpp40) subunit
MKGFFAPSLVESFKLEFSDIISVCGFEHAPLGFDDHENTYLISGENDYAVVNLEHQSILYQAIKFFA